MAEKPEHYFKDLTTEFACVCVCDVSDLRKFCQI